ncbi:hypothetical protein [Tsuneonella suprasediminis]|uniref:hypothetical protein n=1 Tax=Tsuneonella suprasediminis TaxID=2306996 RepID=UPI002F920A97
MSLLKSALPAFATLGWWLIDHLLPDLLPKVPVRTAWVVVIVVSLLLAFGFFAKAWRALLDRFPRPWLPKPFWRVGFWLKHRPLVAILQVAPKAMFVDTTMNACSLSLTISRGFAKFPREAVVRFENSVISLKSGTGKGVQRHTFRPVEAGGFLHIPMKANSADAVQIEFSASGLPVLPSEAPDFQSDYEIELRGVIVESKGPKPLSGELPLTRWTMSQDAHRMSHFQHLAGASQQG